MRALTAERRISNIDGLRGIAIVAVMLYHVPALKLGPELLPAGWLGVDVFFVISGFLITSILLRRDQSLGVFYARRGFRILPLAALYLALVAWLCDQVLLGLYPVPWRTFAPYALFVGNLAMASNPHHLLAPLALLWSLSIEEQFYACWPLAVRRCSRRALTASLLAIVLLSPFARMGALAQWGACTAYYLTPVRLDGLALGALCALHGLTVASIRETVRRLRWVALGALCMLFFADAAAGNEPFLSTAVAALTAIAMLGFSVAPTRALDGALGYIGRRCYALYLLHVVVGMECRHLGLRGGLGIAAFVLASVTLAELTQSLIETPLIRLGRRLELRAWRALPRRAHSPQTLAAP